MSDTQMITCLLFWPLMSYMLVGVWMHEEELVRVGQWIKQFFTHKK